MNKNAFFKAVNEFVIGMRVTCPEIGRELTKLETFIDIGQNTMPKLIIQEFMKKIGPYYKQILDHDETYFREQIDYKSTLNTTCQEFSASDKIKNFIDNLLSYIGYVWDNDTLKKQHKREIWSHLDRIIVLGALATGQGYEHIIAYASQKT